jgi:hypothetical protein
MANLLAKLFIFAGDPLVKGKDSEKSLDWTRWGRAGK